MVIILFFIIFSLLVYILRKNNENQSTVQLTGSSTINNLNAQLVPNNDIKNSSYVSSNDNIEDEIKKTQNRYKEGGVDCLKKTKLKSKKLNNHLQSTFNGSNDGSTLSPLIHKPKILNPNNSIYYV